MPGGTGTEQPKKPVTFADKADLAFKQGRDADALQYLCAHALVADKAAAKELLDKMGWVASQKRPAFAVRWGLGIELSPKTYNGEVFPVGVTQQNVQAPKTGRGTGGTGGAGAAPGTRPGGMVMPGMAPGGAPGMAPGGAPGMAPGGAAGGPAHPVLQAWTGELGQRLVQGLQERFAKGDFGQVLAAGAAAKPAAGGPGGPGDMYAPGAAGGAMMGPQGMPGMAQPGVGQPGMAQPGMQAAGPAPIAPCIVLLGVGSIKELRKQAADAGLDVLCMFSLTVSFIPKNQTVRNETVLALYDVASSGVKEAYKTKAVNNIQVQIARSGGEGNDNVTKELDGLFKYVDSTLHIGKLPAELQSEHVLNRLRGVLAETHENPLPLLAEIRMYETRGLLEEKHLLIAYKRLLGDELGAALATKSEDERKKVLEKWLPLDR